jgi:hypothetical protein
MTAPHADQLIAGYLARLDDAATGFPRETRTELIDNMREHIAEARSRESGPETDATILNILDRLGEPAVVVADARDRLGIGPEPVFRPGLLEFAAMFLLPFVWPFGVILLWSSRAWKTRDKIIASLIPPGGYFGIAFIALTAHAAGFVIQGSGPFPGSGHLYILLIPILVFFAPVYLFARLRGGRGRVSSRPQPRVRGPVA